MIQRISYLSISLISLIFSVGCDLKNKDEATKEKLQGEWGIIPKITPNQSYASPPPGHNLPMGFAVKNDSIEFYLGYYTIDFDSLTNKRRRHFFGKNFQFKVKNDSIFLKDPETEKWLFRWKNLEKQNDTITLYFNDSTFSQFKKLTYDIKSLPDFDQIIFSRSGCYGSCPIMDISINKNGDLFYFGEGYTERLGLFKWKMGEEKRKKIFDKFRKAKPLELLDEYSVSHTDDEVVTTTFIQDGKILKTIFDYGMAGPQELIWAYYSTLDIDIVPDADSIAIDQPYYPKIRHFNFLLGDSIWKLNKSEKFFLQMELNKARLTQTSFKPKYRLTFVKDYTYWGPDPDKNRKNNFKIKSITSNGRYFSFEFLDSTKKIYDLGYNFIDRNFGDKKFRKAEEWEKNATY